MTIVVEPRLPVPGQRVRYGLAIAYALVVLVTSTVPVPDGTLTAMGPLGLVAADRWIHAGTYALLTILIAYAFQARSPRPLLITATLATGYGVGIELVQAFLPFRAFEAIDILANTLGVVLALLCWWVASVWTSG